MNFVEVMLTEKLEDEDPALDILGSDQKILQVCCQDFTNFLKNHWDLVGKNANECKIVEKLEKIFKENADELDEFLNIWTGSWLKKWKQRVKLLIGNQNANKWKKASKALNDVEPLWKKLVEKQELQEIIVATLIKNGEICGTNILSANLLKMELCQKGQRNLTDRERVFVLVNNALRRARDLAQSKGPLIFVKIDRRYYTPTTK